MGEKFNRLFLMWFKFFMVEIIFIGKKCIEDVGQLLSLSIFEYGDRDFWFYFVGDIHTWRFGTFVEFFKLGSVFATEDEYWSNVYVASFRNVINFNVGTINFIAKNIFVCAFNTMRFTLPLEGWSPSLTRVVMWLLIMTTTVATSIFSVL